MLKHVDSFSCQLSWNASTVFHCIHYGVHNVSKTDEDFLPDHEHNKDACALKSEFFLCKQMVLSFPELFQSMSVSLTTSLMENNLQSAGLVSKASFW